MSKEDFEDERFSSRAPTGSPDFPAGYCTAKGCELSAAQAALMSEQNARCPKCRLAPKSGFPAGYSKKPLPTR